MKRLKIVVVGAGSASFGRGAVADILGCEELREFDLTVSLVDIDAPALDRMYKLALMLAEHHGADVRIEADVDRTHVLKGADYVISAVSANRWELWEKDYYIPFAYGFRHVFGENGGPGGAFHTLRSLHAMVPICHDMEKLCPHALLMNFTNPESRVCMAVARLTRLRSVGLCHGAFRTRREVARVAGLPVGEVDIDIAGINHFHWVVNMRERGSGRDLAPEFDSRMAASDCGFDAFTHRMWRLFGLLTYPSHSHPGEYVPFGYELAGPVFLRWGIGSVCRNPSDTAADRHYVRDHTQGGASYQLACASAAEKIRQVAEQRAPFSPALAKTTEELAVPIICDIELDRNRKEVSVNVPNSGCAVANLPQDAIVEVPAVVNAEGIHPVKVGPLPEAIAAMCRLQISIQELLVEAYARRSKRLLLQALLLDPVVDSATRAEEMMEHMLRLQSDYLPALS